jgi:hypothetical protein
MNWRTVINNIFSDLFTNGILNLPGLIANTDNTGMAPNGDEIAVINKVLKVTLQQAGSGAGNGTAQSIGNYKSLELSIIPTAGVSTGTVTFKLNDDVGNWTTCGLAIRVSDGLVAGATTTAISSTTEKWIIPVEGWNQVQAVISNLSGSGGTYTIIGRLVA